MLGCASAFPLARAGIRDVVVRARRPERRHAPRHRGAGDAQGDLRTYAFRVSKMGTLTPKDMEGVVAAFEEAIAELR